MKTLVPSRTHSSPSRLAVVRRLLTSEPACGSVTAYAPSLTSSPAPKHSGTQRAICSGVPDAASPAAASPEPAIARAIPAQPQCSSSAEITPNIPSGSEPIRCRCSIPLRPCSRALRIASHGIDSSASCLAATGRITSVANLRHCAFSSRCSALSAKSIPTTSLPVLPRNRLTGQSTKSIPLVRARAQIVPRSLAAACSTAFATSSPTSATGSGAIGRSPAARSCWPRRSGSACTCSRAAVRATWPPRRRRWWFARWRFPSAARSSGFLPLRPRTRPGSRRRPRSPPRPLRRLPSSPPPAGSLGRRRSASSTTPIGRPGSRRRRWSPRRSARRCSSPRTASSGS